MQDHEAGSGQQQFSVNELITRELDSFTLVERLAWLRNYPDPEVGFIPSGRGEASTAFRYIYHAAKGGATSADSMQGIRMSQMLRADAGQEIAKGDAAVAVAAGNQGAYARQAHRDAQRLGFARQQLSERSGELGAYANAGEFFARELPLPSHGGGQLARFIDGRRMVDEQKKPSDFVMKGSTSVRGGVSEVIDLYTQGQRPEIRDHATKVLSGVSMVELDELLALAEQNETKRLAFWTAHLEDMRADPVAKNVAMRALIAVGATSSF